MPESDLEVGVPHEFLKEVLAFVDIAKKAFPERADEIGVISGNSKGFDANLAIEALLWLSSGLAAKMVDSWFDTYVWPEIRKGVDEPSQEFIGWIKRRLRRGDDQ